MVNISVNLGDFKSYSWFVFYDETHTVFNQIIMYVQQISKRYIVYVSGFRQSPCQSNLHRSSIWNICTCFLRLKLETTQYHHNGNSYMMIYEDHICASYACTRIWSYKGHIYDHFIQIICVSSIWSYVWQIYDQRASKSYVCKSLMDGSYVWIICLNHICVSYMCTYIIIYVNHICVKHIRSYMWPYTCHVCRSYVWIIYVHHKRVKHIWSYMWIIYLMQF